MDSVKTTGTDRKTDDLRRRNVSETKSNGQVEVIPEEEKVKVKKQV